MNRVLLAGVLMLWSGGAAATAECVGTDLIAALPQDQREQLDRAVADAPFNRGILWQARKDTMVMTLVGTFHFADPRHDSTMRRLSGPMQDAAALYVEAGPKEKARLKQALAEDPTLMVNPDGATLPERLSGAEWSLLSDAMALRGTPAIVTAKLRPWYVAMMLGISPCMMRQMAGNGAEGGGRAQGLRRALHGGPQRLVDEFETRTELDEKDVAVERQQVDEHAVDAVAHGACRTPLLVLLEVLER